MAEWVAFLRESGVPACIGKLISNIDLFNTDSYRKSGTELEAQIDVSMCIFNNLCILNP